MAKKKTYLKSESKVMLKFLATRAGAIDAYASVEQALVVLFAHLMGVTPDYAGIPFFRLNNARARNGIIQTLLKKRHGDKFNLFANPLFKELQGLDEQRNHIIHWGLLPVIGAKGRLKRIKLTPQNYWDRNQNTPKMSVEQMYEFTMKCRYFRRGIRMLWYVASGRKPHKLAWLDICQQAIAYPPPKTHALSPKRPELKIPPRSSPA